MHRYLLPLAFLAMVLPVSSQIPDTRGREFFITFLPSYGAGTDGELSDLRIYLSSITPNSATVRNNATGAVHHVEMLDPNQVVEVDLDSIFGNDVELRNGTADSISRKSITVESDDDITLSGVNIRWKSADAFVAYPTDVLRSHNLVMAYGNGWNSAGSFDMPSEFAIVGIEDETSVEIISRVTLNGCPAGVPFTVILDRGEVYFAQAEIQADNDVTGTEINATGPVAIFGGNRRTSIPRSIGDLRDHLVEQIPPTDAWGNDVIVAPFFAINPLSTDTAIVRILSSETENAWSIDGIPQGTLERGGFVDVPLTRAMRITAAAPILVAQYDHSGYEGFGNDIRLGDPCMMIVPAIDNYDTLYAFQSIPHPEFVRHFITIVAPSVSISSLRLDGAQPAATVQEIPGTSFSFAHVEVQAGAHQIRGDSAFGVQVYGYGIATSYAYTGGFVFRRLLTRVESIPAPAAGSLSGIYPNPTAGSSARITLRLDHAAPLTIELIDAGGNVILRPVDARHYTAGVHELLVDIAALPSGTYRIRAIAGDQADHRMLFITR